MGSAGTVGVPTEASGTVRQARWPGAVGIIGIAIGVFMTFDKAMDLARILTWAQEDWRRILTPSQMALVAGTLPSAHWKIATTVFDIGMGVFLVVACFWLFFRDAKSIRALKTWAWMMIAYGTGIFAYVAVWLSSYWDSISGTEGVGVGVAYFGLAVAMGIMLAFPVFLLVWLARADIRAEYETWLAASGQ